MWMSAQLTVQFDKKANVAVISLMKNMLHLFMEIHERNICFNNKAGQITKRLESLETSQLEIWLTIWLRYANLNYHYSLL